MSLGWLSRTGSRRGRAAHEPIQEPSHGLSDAEKRDLIARIQDFYLEKQLSRNELQHKLRIAAAWSSYLDREMKLLAEDEEYPKAHWDSVDFDGTPIGTDRAERLYPILLARCSAVRRHWVQRSPDGPPPVARQWRTDSRRRVAKEPLARTVRRARGW